MDFFTVLAIALGLSADAFTVSVAAGCRIRRLTLRDTVRPGLWFGGFQALMPILGWLGGLALREVIAGFGHWVAFGVLLVVGGKMIIEALRGGGRSEDSISERHSTREMLILAIATSIDALVVGFSLSVLHVSIWAAAVLIGVVTFLVCVVGTLFGCGIGKLVKGWAGIAGGIVLIGIGIKLLMEGLHRA
ncbi:MAG: manganese efflux pump MntP family protein [Candidatus Cryosericum sp.]|nr:manganese efflux pump MntP family protein [bacterium]